MRLVVVAGFGLAMGGALLAFQPPAGRAPVSSNPVVEIKGKIARVQVAPGQGMPFLEVEQNGQLNRVLLGSMRYLVDQNFKPKAGAPVEVRGYRTAAEIVAISVHLPGENKSLRLRDDNGWPVWSRHRHAAGCRCPSCAGTR